jgi:hypothetical protein
MALALRGHFREVKRRYNLKPGSHKGRRAAGRNQ